MHDIRIVRPVSHKVPRTAILVIVRRADGYAIQKRIKHSARTVDIVTQYHARHPDYFVYRVNIHEKKRHYETT